MELWDIQKRQTISKINKARDSLYKIYSSSFSLSGDLIARFEDLTKEKKYPWYIWDMTFEKDEKRTIKVKYRLPSGLAYRNKHRYFKYILHSGAGWYQDIGKAEIILHLNDISLNNIENVSPKGHAIDKSMKTINWIFKNLEPTEEDDIYFQYATPRDKRIYKKVTQKRKRQMRRLK